MSIKLHNHNIVRIKDGNKIINCTIIKMCRDYAQIKFEGKLYRVPYHMLDKVVGHELLMPDQ
ncbi:MAG: hypothetical protein QF872_07900 [Gammaproteobacteria bacterium]|nr:hypothetical protein [Gammaproteobacteria bacterium]